MYAFQQSAKNTVTQGFTLIEILVYIAILIMVTIGSVTLLLSLQDVLAQYQAQQKLITSARTAMERMLTEIRQAETIDLGSSELASSTIGSLTVETTATTTTFTRETDGTLTMLVNGVEQGALIHDDVAVHGLTFFHYAEGPTDVVRIRLQLGIVSELFTDTYTVHGTAIMRESYAN